MATNYFCNVRKENKAELLRFIQAHPDMKLKKILAVKSIETGLKVSTLRTYVEEFIDADVISAIDLK